ncbi:aliphatic sulfonate ABC transporter substrate-binding protein [Derxia lacustris]|uniref:aliphatic sulfonate ABC transporter substrate-binding protein n=1 Tax=Derxia lacustris TaxID=764842 RepID=UPI000A16E568|nr:aliphatic sulfonate ABC transporter substrate-binding protein [Derxia lacustris]
MKRRELLKGAGALALASTVPAARAAGLEELRLDYAYYSPLSLVLKRFGWLEDALKADGTKVKWVFSAGSNRALEYLGGNSIDLGSSAGLAALLAKANGNPIRTVYVGSRPEWTGLLVAKDSPIKTVAELRGKKVAATKGTDPYLFLLRSLREFKLPKGEVEIVHLQHPDGRAALEQGKVDAWAGLDPHMAASELDAGSRFLYRNVGYNTYNFLSAREAFLAEHPAVVGKVITAYEKARAWTLAHLDEAARILAEEARVSVPVALLQVKLRTDFSNPLPSAEHVNALRAAAPILREEALVKPGTDLDKTVAALIDTGFAKPLIAAPAKVG